MHCPKCGHGDTKVIDSRVIENGAGTRRRRQCEMCQHRFTTFERRGPAELMVKKRDGTKELYNRSKLKKAILLSFAKRKVSIDEVESALTELEGNRAKSGNEVDSQQIGTDVLAMLKGLDPVAYLRFASVYMKFNSLEDFKKHL